MYYLKLLFLSYVSVFALKSETNKIQTPKQKKYTELLQNKDTNLVIAHGPAGTGKSWLACKIAIEQLKENKVNKIVLTRPIVSVEDEDLGFLPGNIDEKMNPWIQPLYDIFIDEQSKAELNSMLKSGKIEIVPIGFMRGRTFTDTYVIADEMQNSSPSQMKMILTRLGENSKIVVTGDTSQCDLELSENGLDNLLKLLKKYYENTYEMYGDNIGIIEMNSEDIKRNIFVKKIIDVYSSS